MGISARGLEVYRRSGLYKNETREREWVQIVVRVTSTLAVSSSPAVTIVAEGLSLSVIAVTSLANFHGAPRVETFHDPRNNKQTLVIVSNGSSK